MIDVFTVALLTLEFRQVWAEYVCHDVMPQLWQRHQESHGILRTALRKIVMTI